MTYVIAEPCIGVKDCSCVEECPVDCIYEGGDKMYIHPGNDIDCGACAEVCPTGAAAALSTLLEPQATAQAAANRAFFPPRSCPGGSRRSVRRAAPVASEHSPSTSPGSPDDHPHPP